MTFVQNLKGSKQDLERKCIKGRGNKGPEVGMCLKCWEDTKETSVPRAGWVAGRVRGGESSGVTRATSHPLNIVFCCV